MKKVKQISALLLVCIIIGLVFLTMYFAFTGSPYFMASLFTMIGFPIMVYVYLWIYRLMKGDK